MCSSLLNEIPASADIYTLSLHDALPISRADRRRGNALFQLLLDLRQETAGVRRGERVGEFERGVVARVGVRFHRPGQRALQAFGEIGPELPQLLRLAAQPGDHHLLCVPPLEWQLAREHFEGDNAEG